jgi:YHS domain-containing protein
MPVGSVDDAKLMAWVDDRIVEFTKVYLQIPFIAAYHDKNKVTDPVAKVSFNKLMAKGTIEHKGKTYHFASDDAMAEFKREPDKYANV